MYLCTESNETAEEWLESLLYVGDCDDAHLERAHKLMDLAATRGVSMAELLVKACQTAFTDGRLDGAKEVGEAVQDALYGVWQ